MLPPEKLSAQSGVRVAVLPRQSHDGRSKIHHLVTDSDLCGSDPAVGTAQSISHQMTRCNGQSPVFPPGQLHDLPFNPFADLCSRCSLWSSSEIHVVDAFDLSLGDVPCDFRRSLSRPDDARIEAQPGAAVFAVFLRCVRAGDCHFSHSSLCQFAALLCPWSVFQFRMQERRYLLLLYRGSCR